jgi:LytR cell envelope-related transcriptional attenuator
MDAPLSHPDALIRPWRTATMVASLVAAVELVLLLVVGFVLLAKPLSHAMQSHAEKVAFAPKHRAATVHHVTKHKLAPPKLLRAETKVVVLNGNGRSGAAAHAASQLEGLGYRIRSTGNAQRQDYATSVVMYRAGYAPEGARLARDLHVKVVGPLDGLRPAALKGAQLAIILGAG